MPTIINFLPDGFEERLERRRVAMIGGLAMVIALLSVGTLAAVKRIHVSNVRGISQQVDKEYSEAARQIDQLRAVETTKAVLLRKAAVATSLLDRTPRSYLLANLSNALPTHTSLVMLRMQTKAKKPTLAEKKEADKAGTAARKSGKKGSEEQPVTTSVLFTVEGLAPTDMEVAEYMSQLAKGNLFKNVDLVLSEKFEFDDNTIVRKFTIEFELNPRAMRQSGVTEQPTRETTPAETQRPDRERGA